ncbi:UDP-glucose 4-epimerase GalE [Lysinibacillus sp. CNPSo 3705]|uniref:UDP-glucose 4-epimerase GalE n=1 Tax=Lysinibacillus sp. CNPSo 3705 TaxID=3028148 RepID=UPI002363B7B2|nr:UDP-glucose 4-epimerase GalE [Lysinibacillus sp. CNPSo 3705]MDD1503991.1 UDP-glucose 4-epimerase GalE [Lysinibacillus sp. CNPSo 3705]
MIAVIGGAGYIGSHTTKYLIQQGKEVVVFDNLSTGHREFVPNHIPFIEGDLANKQDLVRLFTGYPQIHTVIHFAAFAYVGESVEQPSKYYQNNVINTIKLLDTMLAYNVKKIVFSSTCATYGNPIEWPITENHPQHPINPYGRTKLMIEQIMEDYSLAYGLKFAALRYFNAAGAAVECDIGEWHEPESHLIPLVLNVALGKQDAISVFGSDFETPDGTCVRDYIHVTDLADAHSRAVEYLGKHEINLKLNLGNGEGYSVLKIVQEVERITGQTIHYIYSERRVGDPAKLVGSSERAKQILGWQPQYNLQQIIETAWHWHQKKFGGPQ